MPLSSEAAVLKTALKRQLRRLLARPQEGGPNVIYRKGQLLAVGKQNIVVTKEIVDELECLRAGAGSAAVWKVIELGNE